MLPGDRLVCSLVEGREFIEGDRFKKWPLHVTIIPWFRLEDSSKEISAGLKKAYTTIWPFSVRVIGEVKLGPKHNRPASLLETNSSFDELAALTRRYLHKKRAWLVDETTKTRRQYLAHVTFQEDKRLNPDDRVNCEHVYIIEQKGEYKEVVAVIDLGKQS